LPIELTMPMPMPVAAAVPVRNADGIGQNNGIDPTTPSVPDYGDTCVSAALIVSMTA
jgi:hypothetical protein